jgi:ComF family protein
MHPIFRTFNAVSNLIFPDLCPVCGKETKISEMLFCVSCLAKLPFTGQEMNGGSDFKTHFAGQVFPDYGIAMFHLNPGSGIAQIIHQIKYYDKPSLAVNIGKFLGEILNQSGIDYGFTRIIPVPLHPDKKKKRGYNQSEKIAQGLSLKTCVPLDSKSLKRIRNTRTQTRLSKLNRIKNTQKAFIFNADSIADDEHILLVDDVLTTGSTLLACAESILELNPVRISMLTIALGD